MNNWEQIAVAIIIVFDEIMLVLVSYRHGKNTMARQCQEDLDRALNGWRKAIEVNERLYAMNQELTDRVEELQRTEPGEEWKKG